MSEDQTDRVIAGKIACHSVPACSLTGAPLAETSGGILRAVVQVFETSDNCSTSYARQRHNNHHHNNIKKLNVSEFIHAEKYGYRRLGREVRVKTPFDYENCW